MATVKELEKRLERERNLLKAKQEIHGIGKKRAELERKIRETRRERKYGEYIFAAKTVGKGVKTVGKGVAKGAGHLQRYAEKVQKQYEPPKQRKLKRKRKTKGGYDNPLEFDFGY